LMSRSDCLERNKPSDYRTGAIIFNAIFSMRISRGVLVNKWRTDDIRWEYLR
jgi:hypothetical protein